MTLTEIERLINEIISLLQARIKTESDTQAPQALSFPQSVEMLTIKECLSVVSGLTESTLRKLITQGKIPSIRAGEGANGKILINKTALINYFNQQIEK